MCLFLSEINQLPAQNKKGNIYINYYFNQDSVYKLESSRKIKNLETIIQNEVKFKIESLKKSGFLYVQIDSTQIIKKQRNVYISNLNKSYLLIHYNENLKKNDCSKKIILNQYAYTRFIKESKSKLLNLENNGFPFAKISFDSIYEIKNGMAGFFLINYNNPIVYKEINVFGSAKIDKQFLSHYLGIFPSKKYNESKIKKIQKRINSLSFVSLENPVEILFTDSFSIINLYLRKQRANQFEGILGFRNNPELNKINLTGNLDLHLINSFQAGEDLKCSWKSFGNFSQSLLASVKIPYVFNSSLGLSYVVDIQKFDTTYLNVKQDIGIPYCFEGLNSFDIFWEHRNTQIINKLSQKNITVFPKMNEQFVNIYGIKIRYNTIDNELYPLRGLILNLKLGAGEKTIKKNEYIDDSIYKNINLINNIINIKGDISYYFYLSKLNGFKTNMIIEGIESKLLFDNDLTKIGGIYSIRGFLENSIPISKYLLISLDYRFFIEEKSYISVFYDYAFTETEILTYKQQNNFKSVGLGLNINTKSGIFNLIYALGKQNEEKFNLNAGKIQFGIKTFL